jgi:putative NIF3 family GTP cyclohydrolase 1 type 2
VDWEDTTDGFLAGDPESAVTGIAVVWMGTRTALTEAAASQCSLCIVHEPLYHGGRHEEEIMLRFAGMREKQNAIERMGLTVYRCHDLWDQMPRIGVPDSWARALDLEHPAVADGYDRVFDLKGETAGSIARRVAAAVRPLGQDAVELLGSSRWAPEPLPLSPATSSAMAPTWPSAAMTDLPTGGRAGWRLTSISRL